jgi:hypothetical protein
MITETELPHAEMIKAVDKGYLCAVCQGRVSVAWGGGFGFNGYILRCQDINHTGITRHDVKEEKIKKEYYSMESTALQAMTETQMVARVGMAKFPKDLTPVEKSLLAQAAITYGFDPIMGEISIFQGKPFISIDGRYRKAQETGLLDGVETRPANKEERIQWEIPDGDYFFRSDVHVKGMRIPLTGWGRVRKSEVGNGQGFQPVQSNPQRMAEKRAEAQALRKAFHIPLPSIEDIGAPDDTDPTVRVVDIKTCEIAETKQGEDVTPPVNEEKWGVVQASWLKESLKALNWPAKDVGQWIDRELKVTGKTLKEVVSKLTQEQAEKLIKEVTERLDMHG